MICKCRDNFAFLFTVIRQLLLSDGKLIILSSDGRLTTGVRFPTGSGTFLFATAPGPALGPIQTEVKRIITHLYLVLKLRMGGTVSRRPYASS
jgi:aconitase B